MSTEVSVFGANGEPFSCTPRFYQIFSELKRQGSSLSNSDTIQTSKFFTTLLADNLSSNIPRSVSRTGFSSNNPFLIVSIGRSLHASPMGGTSSKCGIKQCKISRH